MGKPTIILFLSVTCVCFLQLPEGQALTKPVPSRLDHGKRSPSKAQSGPSGETILNGEAAESFQIEAQENKTPTHARELTESAKRFFAATNLFLHSIRRVSVFIALLPFRVAKLYFSICDFITKSLYSFVYSFFWTPIEFLVSLTKKVASQFGDIVLRIGNILALSASGPTIEFIFVSNPIAHFIISSCHLLWHAALFCYSFIELVHVLVNKIPTFALYAFGLDGILWVHKDWPCDHSPNAIIVLIVYISFLLPFPLGILFSVPSIWYTRYTFSTTSRLSEQKQREMENNVVKISEVFHAFFVMLAIPRLFFALHLPSVLLYFGDMLFWICHETCRDSRFPKLRFPAPFLYVHQWHFFLVKLKNPKKTIRELKVILTHPEQVIKQCCQIRKQSQEPSLQQTWVPTRSLEVENVTENVPTRAFQARARSSVRTRGPVSNPNFPLFERHEIQPREAPTRSMPTLPTRSRENGAPPSNIAFPRWADMEVSRRMELRDVNNNRSRGEHTEDVLSRAPQTRAQSNVGTRTPVSFRDFPLFEQHDTQSQEAPGRSESTLPERSRENRARSSGVTFSRSANKEASRQRETEEENNDSSHGERSGTGASSPSQLRYQVETTPRPSSRRLGSRGWNIIPRLRLRASARARNLELMASTERTESTEPTEPIQAPECAICMETLSENSSRITALVCAHTFHSRCIKTWLEQKTCCPICQIYIEQPTCKISINSR